MVSALSRKEVNQNLINHVKIVKEQITSIPLYEQIAARNSTSEDNFPYALREFINSHLDLPNFDEIVLKTVG